MSNGATRGSRYARTRCGVTCSANWCRACASYASSHNGQCSFNRRAVGGFGSTSSSATSTESPPTDPRRGWKARRPPNFAADGMPAANGSMATARATAGLATVSVARRVDGGRSGGQPAALISAPRRAQVTSGRPRVEVGTPSRPVHVGTTGKGTAPSLARPNGTG